MSQERREWYAEESYDCSPVSRTFSNPAEALKSIMGQVQITVIANTQQAMKGFRLVSKVFDELYPKPLKFDPHVPTRPPHSMAPRPGSRLFDYRGRKRY